MLYYKNQQAAQNEKLIEGNFAIRMNLVKGARGDSSLDPVFEHTNSTQNPFRDKKWTDQITNYLMLNFNCLILKETLND